MEKFLRLRAMGSLCRQQVAYFPDQRWKLLAEAEYWEHLADAEVASHFGECKGNGALAKLAPSANSTDTRWKMIDAA